MSSVSKYLFLMAISVFSFLLGTRMPTSIPEAQSVNRLQPLTAADRTTASQLAGSFPQIPLKLHPPVQGATDLTQATLHNWLSHRSPEVFLTFDDGPSPQATGMILDILKEHDVKATFFVLGHNVVLFPELAQRIVAEGHEIALHSHTHADMLTLTRDQKVQEIAESLSVLHWLFPNQRIRWFRPPYGQYDQEVVEIAHAYGLCIALFNDISIDHTSSAEQITQTVLNGKGKVLVFHDGQTPRPAPLTEPEQRLVQGLSAAIGELKARGGQMKTLSSHFGRFCP
jgi:peptidoglycan/xylan/chitin deacetylase (PgdA/CDA1 family)